MKNSFGKLLTVAVFTVGLSASVSGPDPAGAWNRRLSASVFRQLRQAEKTQTDPECPAYCTKEFLLGKINYRTDTNLFVRVEEKYTYNRVFLKKEVYEAFKLMYEAARRDGVRLLVISGCRTFNDQQCIWDNKWRSEPFQAIRDERERARKILDYVAVPGTSRHHWGTEIDFNSAKLAYFAAGPGKKVYEWLQANAHRFGFYQPYTPIGDGRASGYQEEMWHWSYRPLSAVFLREYVRRVTMDDLKGFEGADRLLDLDVMRLWVEGIHSDCKPEAVFQASLPVPGARDLFPGT